MNIQETSTTLLRDLARDRKHGRWTEFVDRYRPMMEAYVRAHFPSVDADEAVAETLVALVDILADYRYDPKEKGRFHNYLTGILRHKALRLCRRAQRENALKSAWATEPVAVADDPEDEAYRQSLVEIALARFFSDISVASRTKEIFRRVAVKGESPEDVARAYQIERHAVDQLKSRSLEKVRRYVKELEAADA